MEVYDGGDMEIFRVKRDQFLDQQKGMVFQDQFLGIHYIHECFRGSKIALYTKQVWGWGWGCGWGECLGHTPDAGGPQIRKIVLIPFGGSVQSKRYTEAGSGHHKPLLAIGTKILN